MNLHCFIWYRIFYCLGCSIIMLNFNDLKLEPCRPRDDHWHQKISHCYFTPNKIVFQFSILKIQYSQRHGVINHCDRHITPLSDTDISLGLFTYYMLFSYQTGYIMWHSRLRIYIPWGAAEGNIYHMPGMSHYIPCLIAE